MIFKVGDKVRLLSHWNSGVYSPPRSRDNIFIIEEIEENHWYTKKGKYVTRIILDDGKWAEPDEIRHLSKLEQVLK